MTHPVFYWVTLIRVVAAVYILYDPFWGFILSSVLDILDYHIIKQYVPLTDEAYHAWDKKVDWTMYLSELWVMARYGLLWLFVPLFLWRLVGHIWSIRIHRRIVYIFTPNVFEVMFVWIILFYTPGQSIVDTYHAHQLWLVLFLVIKMLQEILIHIIWGTKTTELT